MKIATSFVFQLCVLMNVWVTMHAFRSTPLRISSGSTSSYVSSPLEISSPFSQSKMRMMDIKMSADSTVKIPIQQCKDEWKVIPDIWETLAKHIPDSTMLTDNISPDTGKKASPYHETYIFLHDW